MIARVARFAVAADIALGGFVVAVACAIYLSGFGGAFALNSDMVMPYVVYADAVAGPNRLSGWLLPESPYWFPDLLLTWAIRSVASLNVAVNVFAFVQVASYLFVARWVLGLVAPVRARLAWLVFLLLWLVALLIGMRATDSWFDRFTHYLFVPSTHAAALVITLASLGFVLQLCRAPRRRAPLIGFVALALVTLVSDRLYAVSCLLPLLGLALVPLWPRVARVRVGAAALALLLGSEAWRWLTGAAGTTSHYGPEKTPADSLAQMARDFATALSSNAWASAIVVLGAAALVVALVRALRAPRGGQRDEPAAVAAVFIALSIVLPLAASAALGRHTAIDSFRYCQTVAFVLLPLAWLSAGRVPATRVAAVAWTAAAASVLVLAFAVLTYDLRETALRTEWRAQAECMDRAHAQYGLHNGLSRYWHANSLTAQLSSRAPIFSVSAQLDSVPINKNIDWIGVRARNGAQLPILDFIDEFQFDAATLDAAFGAPRARVQCPLSALRVYAPDAGVLGALYRKNDWLPQDTLARYGRMAVPASLWASGPARIEGDGLRVHARLARETQVAVGALELTRPVRHAWIDYRLAGGDARWQAVAVDANGAPLAMLASGTLAPAAAETHLDLDIPVDAAASHAIAFTLSANGDVDLFVRALGLSLD